MTDLNQIIPLDAPSSDEVVVTWLNHLATGHPFLLAFADDGVIWGKSENDKWSTSFEAFGKPLAKLRGQTLQEAFAFGDQDQVHLYRDGEKWTARQVVDTGEWITESQLLWGNNIPEDKYPQIKGFTFLQDRVQRTMDQALPLEVKIEDLETKAPRLIIHHFIETNKDTGEARIFLSRLVELEISSRDV